MSHRGRTSLLVLLMLALAPTSLAQGGNTRRAAKTVVNDAAAKNLLMGQHRLSLQWISWDYFGKAVVTDRDGTLVIKGEQKGKGNDDYLTIDGVITRIDAKEFKFDGTIVTKVSINNNGQPCTRQGEMTFQIKGNRRYWRLKEMESPCEDIVDYVDIFFSR